MNCGCVKKFEDKLREHLAPTIKGEITSVECSVSALFLDRNTMDLTSGINIPFTVKADAAGYRSAKGKSVPVKANFCPFCGASAKPDTARAAGGEE